MKGVTLGQRDGLSEKDVMKIAKRYEPSCKKKTDKETKDPVQVFIDFFSK